MTKAISFPDVVEIYVSEDACAPIDELRLIKELAYPRRVVAHLPGSDDLPLDPLLEDLAIAGLSEIIFDTPSSFSSNQLLQKAKEINRTKRLGLIVT